MDRQRKKKTMILFGAGGNAHKCYRLLEDFLAQTLLQCVCDNNPSLQNTKITFTDGCSFDIVSPEEAVHTYPDAMYWVTPLGKYRADIIKQLLEMGIEKKRIMTMVSYEDYLSRPFDFRNYKIEYPDHTVTAFFPIELCFTADIEDVPYHKDNTCYNYLYNAPIMKKVTLLHMYRMFMDGKAYRENAVLPEYERRLASVKFSNIKFDYLENLEKFTEHEYWHFHKMNEYLADGNLKFFVDIAPYAKYNPKQRVFNMMDGTHRAMLFYLHGYRHLPLRVSCEDYEQFLNPEGLSAVNKAYEICMTEELEELPPHAIPVGHFSLKFIYTPILHPKYYDIIVSRDAFFQSRADILNEFFAFTSFEGKTMLDIGSNLSYISHNFARQGAVCTCIEYVKQRADLARALTSLYRLEDRVTIENLSFFDYEPGRTFDTGIILAILDHWSTKINSDGHPFLQKLDSLVENMLIWESGNRPEEEKAFIIKNTKFKNYTFVSFTFGTGKCRELGVFTRQGYRLSVNADIEEIG